MMNCCRYNCVYLSVIVALLAGIALGVLYALGFLTTGVVFWVYLATAVLTLLLLPVYSAIDGAKMGCTCVGNYRGFVIGLAIATIVAAVVGLIVALVSTVVVISIVLGIATFLVVFLLGVLVCLSNCFCRN